MPRVELSHWGKTIPSPFFPLSGKWFLNMDKLTTELKISCLTAWRIMVEKKAADVLGGENGNILLYGFSFAGVKL